MKPAQLALLTLLLGLALGSALGYQLGGGDVQVRASSEPESSAAREASDVPPTQSARAPLARVESTSPPSGAALATGDLDGEAGRVAKRALSRAVVGASEATGFDGEITGRVLNAMGAPIVGADVVTRNLATGSNSRVSNATSTEGFGRPWRGLTSVEESVSKSASRTIKSQRLYCTTKTNEAGEFMLTGVRPDEVRVSAYADGFTFKTASLVPGAAHTFEGQAVLELQFDVRLPDGTQPESAAISYGTTTENSTTRNTARWTPAQPTVRTNRAKLTVSARHGNIRHVSGSGDVADFVSEAQTISAESLGTEVIRLDLQTQQLLIVRLPKEREEGQYTLKIASGHVGEDFDWTDYNLRRHKFRRDREVTLPDVQPGEYTVGVLLKGMATPRAQQILVGRGTTEIEVAPPSIDLSDVLRIACEGPSGEPLTGVDIVAMHHSGSSSRGWFNGVRDQTPGETWIPWSKIVEDRGWNRGDRVTLEATHPDFGVKDALVTSKAGTTLIRFEAAAQLTLDLRCAEPQRYTAATVLVSDDSEMGQNSYRSSSTAVRFDAAGQLTTGGLQPGRYRVEIAKAPVSGRRTHGRNHLPLLVETVDVVAPSTALTLSLPPLYELLVSAPESKVGAGFRLMHPDNKFRRAAAEVKLDSEHRAVFSDVPAGTYELIGPNRTKKMSITVPCGEVLYAPKEINCFRVESVTAGGVGHEAGLRAGDLVIGVDGVAFANPRAVETLGVLIMARQCELMVLRGGESIAVPFGPLMDEGGTHIDPGMRMDVHARD